MVLGIYSVVGGGGVVLGLAAAAISLLFVRQLKKDGIESAFASAGKTTACIGIIVRLISVAQSILSSLVAIGVFLLWIAVFVFVAVLGYSMPVESYTDFSEFTNSVTAMF